MLADFKLIFFTFFKLRQGSRLSGQLIREFSLAAVVIVLCITSFVMLLYARDSVLRLNEQAQQVRRLSEATAQIRTVAGELQYWQLRLVQAYAREGLLAIADGSVELAEYKKNWGQLTTAVAALNKEQLSPESYSQPLQQLNRLNNSVANYYALNQYLFTEFISNATTAPAPIQTILNTPAYQQAFIAITDIRQSAMTLDAAVKQSLDDVQTRAADELGSWWNKIEIMLGIAIVLAAAMAFYLLQAVKQIASLVRDLKKAARTDSPTGALNRRAFELRLADDCDSAQRTGSSITLVRIDLDFFKQYNDVHGHIAGDAVLLACCNGWRKALRGRDTVARIGGDEFALLMVSCSQDNAMLKVNRLQQAMPQGVTFSAGVAEWDKSESLLSWSERCDRALYTAKAQGRVQCVVALPQEPEDG